MAFDRIHKKGTNVSVLLMSNICPQKEHCCRCRRSLANIHAFALILTSDVKQTNHNQQTVFIRECYYMSSRVVARATTLPCLHRTVMPHLFRSGPCVFSFHRTNTRPWWTMSARCDMCRATPVCIQRHRGRTLIPRAQNPCTCSHYRTVQTASIGHCYRQRRCVESI